MTAAAIEFHVNLPQGGKSLRVFDVARGFHLRADESAEVEPNGLVYVPDSTGKKRGPMVIKSVEVADMARAGCMIMRY